MSITKNDIEKLANLSRVELREGEAEELTKDMENILGYFEELKNLDTGDTSAVVGGGLENNITRGDEDEGCLDFSRDGLIEMFPEKEGSLLKVPSVFE